MADTDTVDILSLETAWTYKVSVLAQLIARRTSEALALVSDLNLSQWRTLAAIADTPGRTARDVVSVTPMDKGLVSRAVGALVERGLVARRSSPSDGRLSHLHLARTGTRHYGDSRYAAALRRRLRTRTSQTAIAIKGAKASTTGKAVSLNQSGNTCGCPRKSEPDAKNMDKHMRQR